MSKMSNKMRMRMSKSITLEEIETSDQLMFLPIKYPRIYTCYEELESRFWRINEIPPFNKDDYSKLKKEEYNLLKHTLCIFSVTDYLVNTNLISMSGTIKDPTVLTMLTTQQAQENTHNLCYSKLIEQFLQTPNCENDTILQDFLHTPILQKIQQWIVDRSNSADTLAKKIILNTILESVFFSSLFAIIYYFETYLIDATTNQPIPLNALYKSNEFISKDETMHIRNASVLYKDCIKYRMDSDEVSQWFKEGLLLTGELYSIMCPTPLFEINSTSLQEYAYHAANLTLELFEYSPIIFPLTNKLPTNPFPFMNKLVLPRINDFFDDRYISEYKHDKSTISWDEF